MAEVIPFLRNQIYVMPDLASPSDRAKRSNFGTIGITLSSDKKGKMKFQMYAFDLTGKEALEFSLLWAKLRDLD